MLMVNRRTFLGALGLPAATAMAPALNPMKMERALEMLDGLSASTATPQQIATDETDQIGDTSTLADPAVVDELIANKP